MRARAAVVAKIVLVGCIGLLTPAFADAGGIGAGTVSCATFGKRYAENPSIEELYFSWAQGFMTGLNFGSVQRHKVSTDLGSMALSDQMGLIRQYCDAHPLAYYSAAAQDLYEKLGPPHAVK